MRHRDVSEKRTDLAEWIDDHVERAGGDVRQGLSNLFDELRETAEAMERGRRFPSAPSPETPS